MKNVIRFSSLVTINPDI